MVAEREAMGFELPAAPLQPLGREDLSLPSVTVAGVSPLLDGSAAGGHVGDDGDASQGGGDPVNATGRPELQTGRKAGSDRRYFSG